MTNFLRMVGILAFVPAADAQSVQSSAAVVSVQLGIGFE